MGTAAPLCSGLSTSGSKRQHARRAAPSTYFSCSCSRNTGWATPRPCHCYCAALAQLACSTLPEPRCGLHFLDCSCAAAAKTFGSSSRQPCYCRGAALARQGRRYPEPLILQANCSFQDLHVERQQRPGLLGFPPCGNTQAPGVPLRRCSNGARAPRQYHEYLQASLHFPGVAL